MYVFIMYCTRKSKLLYYRNVLTIFNGHLQPELIQIIDNSRSSLVIVLFIISYHVLHTTTIFAWRS